MPAARKMKEPVEPLSRALDRTMELIGGTDEEVAIFMVGGEITSTKRRSQSFENNVARLVNNLVGVYNLGADACRVREDLAEFYAGVAA
jgi:UV DNA damage repair endonuclease